MFPLWWGFKGWLDNDDPWQEHAKWFPNCVYIRYVMEGNVQKLDDKVKKCTVM
jgi:Inhibitor of Apoptosis domain.